MKNNNKHTVIIVFVFIMLILTYIPRLKEMFQNNPPSITASIVKTQDMSGIVNSIMQNIKLLQKNEDSQQEQDDRLVSIEKRLERIF